MQGQGPGGAGAETWVFSEHGSPSAGRLALGGPMHMAGEGGQRTERGRLAPRACTSRSSVLFHCRLLPSLQCSLGRGRPGDLLRESKCMRAALPGALEWRRAEPGRKERRQASEAPYPAQTVGSGDLERRRRLCARGGGPALEGSFCFSFSPDFLA